MEEKTLALYWTALHHIHVTLKNGNSLDQTRMIEERKKILIVDDEPAIRDSLQLLLKSSFDVSTAEDGAKAMSVLDSLQPDIVLLDVIMPNLDGIETLRQIKEKNPYTPVIMLTATNTVKTAVQAMKYGAIDYLNKPFHVEELIGIINSALDFAEATGKIKASTAQGAKKRVEGDFGSMVGKSSSMQELFGKIKQVAARDTTVLITGESGTGKELVAKLIHENSPRKDGPFVAVNCAAIPETLIESELFGHEKGAFTHAVEKRLGHFELANKGTLFLDEIGELTPAVQVKLLRFLQEQEFYRVGRSKPTRVDVRVITATNQDLEENIKKGTFRQDLFYRINVVRLHLAPLRDRYDDIKNLVDHFVEKYSPVYGGRALNFTDDSFRTLIEYPWPGNVRELENVVESLMALSSNDEISEEMLPPKLRIRANMEALRGDSPEGKLDFGKAERDFEMELITKALKKTNYVQTRAAALLGISRRILKYKMDKLGISDSPVDAMSEKNTEAEGSAVSDPHLTETETESDIGHRKI